MDFRQLEAFVNVVRYKSFSRAADASFLTQPTVSAHISSLEKELGIVLIDRCGKESLPTAAGRVLYDYAVDLLNTRERAEREVCARAREIEGTLTIQASGTPAEYILPELAAEFHALHPGIRFYIEESDSAGAADNIREGKGELGFIGCYDTKELNIRRICQSRCVLLAPNLPEYRRMGDADGNLDFGRLAGKGFLFRETGSATRSAFEEACRKKGVEITQTAAFSSIGAVKRAVAAGLGVSVLPELAVTGEEKGVLVFPITDPSFDRAFYMVKRRKVSLSPLAACFESFVSGKFPQGK